MTRFRGGKPLLVPNPLEQLGLKWCDTERQVGSKQGSSGKRVPGTVVFVSYFSPKGLGLAPFVLAVASVSPLLDRTDGEDDKGRPPFV